jgi:hypothetical protein
MGVHALRACNLVIDATDIVTAIHQNHTHDHIARRPDGERRDSAYDGPERDINLRLAGRDRAGLDAATHRLTREGLVPLPPRPPLRLVALHPSSGSASRGFNVQPSGLSALAVELVENPGSTVIVFNGETLTSLADDRFLTALVPPHLYTNPGLVEVWVQDFATESNRLVFELRE